MPLMLSWARVTAVEASAARSGESREHRGDNRRQDPRQPKVSLCNAARLMRRQDDFEAPVAGQMQVRVVVVLLGQYRYLTYQFDGRDKIFALYLNIDGARPCVVGPAR